MSLNKRSAQPAFDPSARRRLHYREVGILPYPQVEKYSRDENQASCDDPSWVSTSSMSVENDAFG